VDVARSAAALVGRVPTSIARSNIIIPGQVGGIENRKSLVRGDLKKR